MTESAQPTAVELVMVVKRACRVEGCSHFMTIDCPHHAKTEDKGVVISTVAQAGQKPEATS